jgi:uncharacterized membrane protein
MTRIDRGSNLLIILGSLLTLTELGMSLLNSSLCSNAGCRIVESYLLFDQKYMYAFGFLFFCTLYVTSIRKGLNKYTSPLLMFALASEGYLIAFQVFIAHTICPFCIAVALVILAIALLKFISGPKEPIILGVCLFALTGFLVGSINVSSTPLPSAGRCVLIYAKGCPHCEDVIKFSREKAIPLTLVEAREVKGALSWLGIHAVPVLVCDDDEGKKLYSGDTTIKSALTAKYGPFTKATPAQIQPAAGIPSR